jgi:hypothetical protein
LNSSNKSILTLNVSKVKSWFKNRRYRQKKSDHQPTFRDNDDGTENDLSQQDDKSASANETFEEDPQEQDNTAHSDSTENNGSNANHSILKQQLNQSSSLLAAAALAAVTTKMNNPPLFSYHPFQSSSMKITKALNDELELVFDKQQYISNTQRDFLAEKFRVASAQITNWFQNKRRKLKRIERMQNSSKIKDDVNSN